jgi:hypothetical protein
MTFTIEIVDSSELAEGKAELELCLDQGALRDLITQLSFLKNAGDHAHFMTPAWGGTELTEEPQLANSILLNHLRITLVDDSQ